MHFAERVRTFRDKYPLVGPVLWLLSIQYFIAQAAAALAWRQPYSLLHNTISDLGNTACGAYGGRFICSPRHSLMNISFIVLGVTMLAGSGLVYHEFKKSRLSALGFTGMGLAGFGTILVGVFPENTVSVLHFLGALLPFFIGNLSIGLLGLALDIPKQLRAYSIVTSAVTLIALGLFLGHAYLGIGVGGMERLTSYPQTIWLMTFGAYISRNRYRRQLSRR